MGNRSSALVAVDNNASSATAFSRDEQRVMAEFLPDFQTQVHSSKKDQETILTHWEKIFSQAKMGTSTTEKQNNTATTTSPMVLMFDNFYKYLFEIAPETKPMFRHSMQVQGKALVRIVASIKNMLQSPDIITFAANLAHRHVGYGIKLYYFNAMGLALVKTIESCAPELWTAETAEAWRRVYAHVALIVVMALGKETGAFRRSSLTMRSQRNSGMSAKTQTSMARANTFKATNQQTNATNPTNPTTTNLPAHPEESFMHRMYVRFFKSSAPKYEAPPPATEAPTPTANANAPPAQA